MLVSDGVPPSGADRALAEARSRGVTVAVAESLTGGLVCAMLTEAPGASDVVRGGVVAYQVDVKREVLGVPGALLDAQGPVCDDVAFAMADGVKTLLRASVGIATTGVAGPEPHGGKPPGRVHIAAVGEGVRLVRHHDLVGDRISVVAQTCALAIELLGELVLLTPQRARREGEQL
ncbi:MAG: hypothetical protein CVT64_08270 [Actinobacteria bacterium HGW-Actinobacteria-4]|nr:MAG: hypothetical protein CVT64_08270 [Actinobacteria bacterium HGW-Actinobacteria-4]